MSRKQLLVLGLLASLAFLAGYGAVAKAWPYYGRQPYYGYFHNVYDAYGVAVWPPNSDTPGCAGSGGNALPKSVNTATKFINFVKCKLKSKNDYSPYRARERTGAAFIIQTMIGTSRDKTPSASAIADWEARIRYASFMGWIRWNVTYRYSVNSYFQGSETSASPNDVAFYSDNGSGAAITFRQRDGKITYAIRLQCANPVGVSGFSPLDKNPSFDIDATTTLDNSSPVPGETIRFTHRLSSDGNTSPVTINWRTQNMPGGSTVKSGNAGTFTKGQTKTVSTENYRVPLGTPAGTQICRRVAFNPEHQNGGSDVSTTRCATVRDSYSLVPSINVKINDGSVPGNFAEPGDTITFTYAVNNQDNGPSSNTSCAIHGISRDGYYEIPNPIDNSSDPGFAQPAHNCPRNFPGNSNTVLVTETISGDAVSFNKSICRSLFVDPASPDGGSRGVQVCAYVTAKPYSRAFGGDVSVGGGFASSLGACEYNEGAAVIGWNKRAEGGWAGMGVQFATYAMNRIFDGSTSLGNGGGGAAPPAGLSFSNSSTNPSAGNFGGFFGSVACAPDHYAGQPQDTSHLGAQFDISGLGSGVYSASGNVRVVGGTVNPGEKIDIYIDGDLFVGGNIVYGGDGSWSVGNVPQLRIIVNGNIFIGNNVTRVDGLYVAQPSGNADGIIVTCTTADNPYAPLPLDGALASSCNNKLTVNGSFIARQVRLMRTAGTLRDSNAGEDPSANGMAEVFNYNPALWITQPSAGQGSDGYDAINSLPPVL